MGNRESVARFLQAWREDYSYQTLAGAAMVSKSPSQRSKKAIPR